MTLLAAAVAAMVGNAGFAESRFTHIDVDASALPEANRVIADAVAQRVAARSRCKETNGIFRIAFRLDPSLGGENAKVTVKNGYDAGKYVSFEEQINNYKDFYYEALRQSSVGWHTNENSYFPFIENFLSTLYMCYKELDKRFAVVHGKRITKKAANKGRKKDRKQ